MKVGTDAVLLGAWASANEPARILDIGTGCGVIALMLAQRFSQAYIDAIDIDENSITEAQRNFQDSPWGSRLHAHHQALQYWSAPAYDLIVSNPPYFANSFPITEKSRALARTHRSLDFETLIRQTKRLLNQNGKFALVLPAQFRLELEKLLVESGLFLHRTTLVLPTTTKKPSLVLLESSCMEKTNIHDELVIRAAGAYHPDYLKLTRDFYLFS